MIKNTLEYLPTIYNCFEIPSEHQQAHNLYIMMLSEFAELLSLDSPKNC